MTISAFLIIPAAYKSAANAVGLAMGWGPHNYDGVALSADGGATVTHWACRTDVDQVFLATILAAGYDLTRAGLSPDQIAAVQAYLDAMDPQPYAPPGVDAVLAALDVNVSETLWGIDHATAVLADNGLVRVADNA